MTSIHAALWIMWPYLPITIKYCVRAVLGRLADVLSPIRSGFDSKPIRVGFVEDKVLRLSSRNHNTTAPYSFLRRSSTLYTIFAIGSVVERHNNNKNRAQERCLQVTSYATNGLIAVNKEWLIELRLMKSVEEPRHLRRFDVCVIVHH